MPYIMPEERAPLIMECVKLGSKAETVGQLTYVFTKIGMTWVKIKGVCFMNYCLCLGALLCTILEIYRRWIGPYEDEKKGISGDVI